MLSYRMFRWGILAGLFCLQLASAQSLADYFELPNNTYNNSLWGLTTDGTSLYVSSSSTSASDAGTIYQYDFNGNQTGSIVTPLGSSQGLAWDGTHFWYFWRATTATSGFYRVATDGSVVDTLLTGTNYVSGCHWDGSYLWYSLYFPDAEAGYYKLDVTTGAVVDTFLTFHKQPHGITDDGTSLYWSGDDFSADDKGLFISDPATFDTTGHINLLDPFSQNPRGVAYDGQFLWIIGDPTGTANRALFKYDLAGGAQPNINIAATEVEFGVAAIGGNTTAVLAIGNIGDGPLEVDTLTFSNAAFSSNQAFPVVIPPGGSAIVEMLFSPAAFGDAGGSVTVSSNDPLDPALSIPVHGFGLFPNPVLSVSDTTLDFGEVWTPGGVAEQRILLINQGIEVATDVSLNVSGDGFFSEDLTLMFPVPANDTLEFRLFFSPNAPGTASGEAIFSAGDPGIQLPPAIALSGNGVTGPYNLGTSFWEYQVPDNPRTSLNEYRPLAIKPIADLTGDGLPDVVIATRNYWIIALDGAAANEGIELWRFTTYIANTSAGAIGNTNDLPPQQRAMTIANDLNGDGLQDVVIGTGGGNERVYALSGADGSIIWDFGTDDPAQTGLGDITAVKAGKDFNGDGINDILAVGSATNSGVDGRRTVYCFDGTNGSIIWQYFVGAFLRDVVPIGDVNNNGSIEVAVTTGDGISNANKTIGIDPIGAGSSPLKIWEHDNTNADGGGRDLQVYEATNGDVDVISGSFFNSVARINGTTGATVWDIDFALSGVNMTRVIPDVSGDGEPDVLVCSFSAVFYCLDGADGTVVWDNSLGNFSWSADLIDDINGDGFDEVLVACRDDNLYILDGSDGVTITTIPFNSGFLQGVTLTHTLPDMDGNGLVEILGAADDGQIRMISGGIPPTGIADQPGANLPENFVLGQNYPNPFNPETRIKFSLPRSEAVTLIVSDLLGREVMRVYDGKVLPGGVHEVSINGAPLASGVYFYRLEAGSFKSVKRMILLK